MGSEDLTLIELIMLMDLSSRNKLSDEQKVRIANLDISDFGKVFNGFDLEVPEQLDLDMGSFTATLTMMSIAIGVSEDKIHALIHYLSKTLGTKTDLMKGLYSIVWSSNVPFPQSHSTDYVEPYEFHINTEGVLFVNIGNAMIDVTFLKNILCKYETLKINNPDMEIDKFLSLVNDNMVE